MCKREREGRERDACGCAHVWVSARVCVWAESNPAAKERATRGVSLERKRGVHARQWAERDGHVVFATVPRGSWNVEGCARASSFKEYESQLNEARACATGRVVHHIS